jgi:sarcosine oxidase subunit alpha
MVESTFRLDAAGRVDRSHKLAFKFNDRKYVGYAGDTLASALLANGVSIVGRSFKYHRPRGIMMATPRSQMSRQRHCRFTRVSKHAASMRGHR